MSIRNLPKPAIIMASILLIAGISFGVYALLQPDAASPTSDDINYGPPTDTEIEETQSHKESLGNDDDQSNTTTEIDNQTNKQKVVPVISYEGQNSQDDFEVNGYVPGIVEHGGECKVTLTSNGKTANEAKTALEDAQSTSCGLIVISRSKLSAGKWQLVLSYNSDNSAGSSDPVEVSIK